MREVPSSILGIPRKDLRDQFAVLSAAFHTGRKVLSALSPPLPSDLYFDVYDDPFQDLHRFGPRTADWGCLTPPTVRGPAPPIPTTVTSVAALGHSLITIGTSPPSGPPRPPRPVSFLDGRIGLHRPRPAAARESILAAARDTAARARAHSPAPASERRRSAARSRGGACAGQSFPLCVAASSPPPRPTEAHNLSDFRSDHP